jgi:hypothetical protein
MIADETVVIRQRIAALRRDCNAVSGSDGDLTASAGELARSVNNDTNRDTAALR